MRSRCVSRYGTWKNGGGAAPEHRLRNVLTGPAYDPRRTVDSTEAFVILYLSYEELAALNASAEHVLAARSATGHGIAAPPLLVADVEQFAQRLTGDITLASLE